MHAIGEHAAAEADTIREADAIREQQLKRMHAIRDHAAAEVDAIREQQLKWMQSGSSS